eukprot:COSAG06_NODE_4904_length_3870_cov_223.006364_3_plen_68_part_00
MYVLDNLFIASVQMSSILCRCVKSFAEKTSGSRDPHVRLQQPRSQDRPPLTLFHFGLGCPSHSTVGS